MLRTLAIFSLTLVFASHSFGKVKCDPVEEMKKLGFLNGQWVAKDNYQFSFSYSLKNHVLSTDVEQLDKKGGYLGKGTIAHDCRKGKYVYLYLNNVGDVDPLQGELKEKHHLYLRSLPGDREITFDFQLIDGKMHWIYRGKKDGKWKIIWSTIAERIGS